MTCMQPDSDSCCIIPNICVPLCTHVSYMVPTIEVLMIVMIQILLDFCFCLFVAYLALLHSPLEVCEVPTVNKSFFPRYSHTATHVQATQ